MPSEQNQELVSLYELTVAAITRGDMEGAADSVLRAACYHGIVNGNNRSMELFLVGSGAIEGIQSRRKAARQMTSTVVKLLDKEEVEEESEDSIDYDARLKEAGK